MTTTNKSLNQPVIASTGWGAPINENASILDKAFGSFITIASTSGVTALTSTDVQNMCIKSTTTALVDNTQYTIPAGIAGQWVIINQSAANPYALTVKVAGGSDVVTIPNGETHSIYSDGSKVVFADTPYIPPFTPVQQGGGAGQGSNKIYLGWTGSSLAAQVDSTNMGNIALESMVATANNSLIKSALNAGGSPPIYACRAWANISAAGAIYGSANVSAVSRSSTGSYYVYFATAMPNTGFSAVMSSGNQGLVAREGSRSSSYVQIVNTDAYYALRDSDRISIAIFG